MPMIRLTLFVSIGEKIVRLPIVLLVAGWMLSMVPTSYGQTYGVELHNSLMPASSGMGGASLSQPQDLQSAIYGNPATMIQFEGTQFSFGGGWAEPTYNITQTSNAPLAGVSPFQAKSQAPGSLIPNIGVLFDTSVMGRQVKVGIGFLGNAGIAVDFRQVPESNGTHASLLALDLVNSVAMQMTDRMSVGASFNLGTGVLDGPFASSSSSQTDYATRGSIGLNYDLGQGRTFGAYWQSRKDHSFNDIARFPTGSFQDINLAMPSNFGFGIANRNLMCGRLLLATDVLFKQYSDADFFKSVYDDQWVFQFGSQYIVNPRIRLRAGYAYNENPLLATVPLTIGGTIPIGGLPAVQYVQGQFASVSQHRMTGGVGIRDVMPGMDLDLSVGGMFRGTDTFGGTTASVESYWVAFGLTWRCGCTPIASSNCVASESSSMQYAPQSYQ